MTVIIYDLEETKEEKINNINRLTNDELISKWSRINEKFIGPSSFICEIVLLSHVYATLKSENKKQ